MKLEIFTDGGCSGNPGPAAIGVVLMLLLTITSQRFVTPKLAGLRTQMGSVAATPANDPLRIEFNRLHKISVNLEGSVLLIGFAALFLTVREMTRFPAR